MQSAWALLLTWLKTILSLVLLFMAVCRSLTKCVMAQSSYWFKSCMTFSQLRLSTSTYWASLVVGLASSLSYLSFQCGQQTRGRRQVQLLQMMHQRKLACLIKYNQDSDIENITKIIKGASWWAEMSDLISFCYIGFILDLVNLQDQENAGYNQIVVCIFLITWSWSFTWWTF